MYKKHSNNSTEEQLPVRIQPLRPHKVIVDSIVGKKEFIRKHKYIKGYNCWTAKPINKEKLLVNHIRKRVCFTEETTYYSSYTDKVIRRDDPVRSIIPSTKFVWVRTCEYIKKYAQEEYCNNCNTVHDTTVYAYGNKPRDGTYKE